MMNDHDLRRALQIRLDDAYNSTKKRQLRGSCTDPVTLTLDELVEIYHKQEGRCPELGVVLTPVNKESGNYIVGNRWTTISIDRLDNSRGYSKDNVRLTCWAVNCMRGTKSIEEAHAQALEFTELLQR